MATKLEKIIKHFVRMAAVQGGKNGNKARKNNKAFCTNGCSTIILLTKMTAAQIDVGHSYYSVRGLYFLIVVFAATTTFRTMESTLSGVLL